MFQIAMANKKVKLKHSENRVKNTSKIFYHNFYILYFFQRFNENIQNKKHFFQYCSTLRLD